MKTQEVERQGLEQADGAAEKVAEIASQTKEQVQEQAGVAKDKVWEQARTQLDARSDQLGEHIASLANALHSAGDQLQGDGKATGAKATYAVAERAERLGTYLSGSNADRFLDDVERFGRRHPWAASGVGAAVGFVAARFLKASSETRYQSSRQRPSDNGTAVDRSTHRPSGNPLASS